VASSVCDQTSAIGPASLFNTLFRAA
jgi:hypothetical protein